MGDEQFIVLFNDDGILTIFSKYNLNVGNNPTYLQDSTMTGYNINNGSAPGTVSFSSSVGWSGSDSIIAEENYGYDIKNALSNYLMFINNNFNANASIRLINREDLTRIKKSTINGSYEQITGWAPNWVYSTSYWVSSPVSSLYSNLYVQGIFSSGALGNKAYNDSTALGIRPIIIIDEQKIDEI